MDADEIFLNFEDGMTVEELHERFGSDKDAIRQTIEFARPEGTGQTLEDFVGNNVTKNEARFARSYRLNGN